MPLRPVGHCAPIPIPILPDLVTLPGGQTEAQTLRRPDPLSVSNGDYELTCVDMAAEGFGPTGDSVVVAAGQDIYTRNLFWEDLPDITPSQLHYLTFLSEEALAGLLDDGVDATDVQTVTRLSAIQAEVFVTTLATLRDTITVELLRDATLALHCAWLSEEQTVECEDENAALTGVSTDADLAGVVNPVVVPVGAVDSQVSQAHANALARLEGLRSLVCRCGNEALTITCESTVEEGGFGFEEAVPTDDPNGNPVTPDGRFRIGSVTVAANRFFAPTKAEADALARVFATASLECFFINTLQSVECADADAFISPTSVLLGVPGNPVAIPAGSFALDGIGATQAGAEALAQAQGTLLLECRFLNTEQVVTCPSVTIGDTTLIPENSAESITVPAGEYEGDSLESANNLAIQSALLQLGCRYCNSYIPPSCYPPAYDASALIAAQESIPAADVTKDWSVDVILGISAGAVCNSDPEEAQAVAQSISLQRPLLSASGCTYANDELWVGCLLELPAGIVPPLGVTYHHPEYAEDADDDPEPFINRLSDRSIPSPIADTPYIVISAGTYSINSADPAYEGVVDLKAAANEQARLYGLALLSCLFANTERTLNCTTAYPERTIPFDMAAVVQPGDNPAAVITVVIPRGQRESVISFADAMEAALNDARAVLNCYYASDRLEVACWPGYAGLATPEDGTYDSGTDTWSYGTGTATRNWIVLGTPYSEVVTLQDHQLGSLANPVIVPAGAEESSISKANANAKALLSGIMALDCTSQAIDAVTVCSEKMRIRCGGVIEPNPMAPFKTGDSGSAGQPITGNWNYGTGPEAGLLLVGNGHNYVVIRDGSLLDLGAVSGSPGGVGSPLDVPACIAQGATQEEANLLAYLIMKDQLDCTGSEEPPEVTSATGSDKSPGFPWKISRISDSSYQVAAGKVADVWHTTGSYYAGVGSAFFVKIVVTITKIGSWVSTGVVSDVAISVTGGAQPSDILTGTTCTVYVRVGSIEAPLSGGTIPEIQQDLSAHLGVHVQNSKTALNTAAIYTYSK